MANDKFFNDEEEKGKSYFWLMLSSFIANVLTAGAAIFFYGKLQPQIPLFYTLADGNDQLVEKKWLFLLPVIALMINVIHLLLLRAGKNYDDFLKRLFALITLIFQILILAITLRIIILVT